MIDYTRIRPDIIESLKRYVMHRIQPGDFLLAVLENDLMEACGRADEDNQRSLFDLCAWIYNELPAACHGSPAFVQAWLNETNEYYREESAKWKGESENYNPHR